ncbi:hypothetical protein E4631_19910 [Hymenobacter sp. UV11]|jgi:hypothetical protein|uniref:hypothetical protein n=1 Tax=Hymenobacter sp. UV11 TaxID=1849735 RepID=UPI00105E781D|nr:hypothetical protein [Hymenobacter sp. UV11]TDN36972.1 hypothetical protein A8B98_06160 [Hymenobacter sp. UV11]TFZ64268.1 hypothetical protein E4631_19910 [Hymenobacter sp. UV11]
MATSSGPRDINDLLTGASRAQPPRPPQASPIATPPPAAPPLAAQPAVAAPATRKGTFILTEANDDALHRLSFYTPGPKGEKSYLINKALEAYLAQFPDSQRPIPEGEDVRRRGRRHH